MVLVADDDGNGSAEGEPVVDAGEDLGGVGFVARGDDLGLPKWNVHVPEGYEVYKHLLIFSSFYLVRTIVAGT